MESSLNKSKNFYRCVGNVYEKALKREPCKVKIYDKGKPTGEEVNAECIKGKVSVRADDSIIDFPIYFASKGLDGNDSSRWEMAMSMMDWTPEVNGNGDSPTVVCIEGRIEGNMFISRDGKEVKDSTNFRVSKASTSVKENWKHGMTVVTVGYVSNIVDETKVVDGEAEETGRGLMTIFVANSKGEVFPVTFVVEEEFVDDVKDAIEVGNTVEATLNVDVKTVGRVKPKRGAIGRGGKVDTSTDYSKVEFIMGEIVVIEEPDELITEDEEGNEVEVKTDWMNPVAVKKAIKAYKMRKDELLKSGGKKTDEPSSRNFKDKKADIKARKSVGKKTADLDEDDMDGAEEEDEDELPF